MGIESWVTRRSSDARAITASLSAPERFAAIFDRHYDAIHAYLARRVDVAHADDLASTTFTIAFERRRSFRPEATSARPWLYGIATNLLREQWRANQRSGALVDRLQGDATHAGAVDSGDFDDELAAALTAIDPDQLTVLLLVAWEELSYAEVAEALAIPVGTVRSRLARAREQLTARLTTARQIEEQETR